MLANISTPPTPSVTAWLRCSSGRGPAAGEALDQGRRPQRPGDVQRRLQRHLGEVEHLAQRAGFGHAHPAHVEVEVEVGVDHPARRRRRQRRHRRPSAAAAAPCGRRCSNRARKRSQSGVVSRISTAMIPERVRGLASPRCSSWSTALSSSGSPAASNSGTSLMVAATLPSLLLLPSPRRCSTHASPPQLAATCLWWLYRSGSRTVGGGLPSRWLATNHRLQFAECGSVQHPWLLTVLAGVTRRVTDAPCSAGLM